MKICLNFYIYLFRSLDRSESHDHHHLTTGDRDRRRSSVNSSPRKNSAASSVSGIHSKKTLTGAFWGTYLFNKYIFIHFQVMYQKAANGIEVLVLIISIILEQEESTAFENVRFPGKIWFDFILINNAL